MKNDETNIGKWDFSPADVGEIGADALKPITDRTNERGQTYSATAAGDGYFEAGSYKRVPNQNTMNYNFGESFVGMNATKAKDVAAKINATVDRNLVTLVDQISGDASEAFKGPEAQAAFNDYIVAVKRYIGNLITDLKAFSDKIYEVGDLYAASDKSLAGKISASAGFAGSAYTAQRATTTAGIGYGNQFVNATGKQVVPLAHDLNGDGKVDASDAQQALMEGKEELAAQIQEEAGNINVGNAVLEGTNPLDLNGDGKVDAVDASIAERQDNPELAHTILEENANLAAEEAAAANPHDLNGDGIVDSVDASIAKEQGNESLASDILAENAENVAADATGEQTGDVPEGGYPSEGGEIPETPAEDAPAEAPTEAPVEETTDAPAEEPAEPQLDVMYGSN